MNEEIIILGDIVITPLVKAHKALAEVLTMKKTDVVRDASIQRFEFTFELAWKTLRRILMQQGVRMNTPRNVFRLAAEEKIIDDPKQWFTYLDSRNNTTHVYNELIAEKIYAILPEFSKDVAGLIEKIKTL